MAALPVPPVPAFLSELGTSTDAHLAGANDAHSSHPAPPLEDKSRWHVTATSSLWPQLWFVL
jgi:hypothetical protein